MNVSQSIAIIQKKIQAITSEQVISMNDTKYKIFKSQFRSNLKSMNMRKHYKNKLQLRYKIAHILQKTPSIKEICDVIYLFCHYNAFFRLVFG